MIYRLKICGIYFLWVVAPWFKSFNKFLDENDDKLVELRESLLDIGLNEINRYSDLDADYKANKRKNASRIWNSAHKTLLQRVVHPDTVVGIVVGVA